ncbi:hypothetical protein EK21DRAFT_91382 [Setomelanomma holmii]|uniref:Uncharacterized protein n=1 Tax=Setomelanomma holmii TaxID=210430 RepID=A0A9P4H5Q0_9PLEO|nr:hypothetical protein EK21DRAFT_91382 [Setomelanomma holmii]
MCKQHTITHNCPVPCGYSTTAWSTHCDYSSLDNVQGYCGFVDGGGDQQMGYPCPTHRGLNDPRLAPLLSAKMVVINGEMLQETEQVSMLAPLRSQSIIDANATGGYRFPIYTKRMQTCPRI